MKVRIAISILVVTAVLGCQRKETRAPVSEKQQGAEQKAAMNAMVAQHRAAAKGPEFAGDV